jgi:hypothetical protein
MHHNHSTKLTQTNNLNCTAFSTKLSLLNAAIQQLAKKVQSSMCHPSNKNTKT